MFSKMVLITLFLYTLALHPCNAAPTLQQINQVIATSIAVREFVNGCIADIEKWITFNNTTVEKREIEGLKDKLITLHNDIQSLQQQLAEQQHNPQNLGAVINDIKQQTSEIQGMNETLFAQIYLNGDDKKSFEFFKETATKNAIALYYLGLMYEDGKGLTVKNPKKACELFRQAAKQKYQEAIKRCTLNCGDCQ